MPNDNNDLHKYEETPHERWSKRAVNELRSQDVHRLYACLPRIVQDESLDAPWKVQFILSLLKEEENALRRARAWDALTILARVAPQCDLTAAASLAWSMIDSFTSDDAMNTELRSVQDFLEDVRIFAYSKDTDREKITSQAKSESRFAVFTAFRAMCAYHDIVFAGRRALELSSDTDFVLRESAVNGICVIYSRPDCDPPALGHLRDVFSQALIDRSTDSHWYVRKATDTALFFRSQFDKEYGSAAE